MDTVIKAGVVRNEVAEVLKSDRLNLLGSCEAHVFKLNDGKWVDLTEEPVLVHLIRDNLEGVTKMLAVSTHKLIIHNVPVSSNFNVFAPSKKFIQFVCNKFDKNTDNYGFGFSGVGELELFLQLLNRIKHVAMASLTPSFHSALVATQSPRPLATVPRSTEKQTVLNYAPTGVPGFGVPYGYAASPIKNVTQLPAEGFNLPADPRSFLQDQPGLYHDEESSSRSSTKSNDADKMPDSPSDLNQGDSEEQFEFIPDVSNQDPLSPTLPTDPMNGMHGVGVPPGITAVPESVYAFADRRLHDLIASFESKPLLPRDESPLAGDFVEHPIGPIGSPLKKSSSGDVDR